MKKQLEAVATTAQNGHKRQIKPHEIVSGDRLDAIDLPYFQKASEAFERARQLQAAAQQAAIEAQAISNAFFAVAKDKYSLGSKDQITPEGVIIRVPSIEIVG